LMIWYCNAFDYPILIGGKPMFSPPMSVVPSYILLVLAAAVGAFVGMIALNELPRLHHPLFKNRRFALVSRDKFFLAIGATDPKFSETATRSLLQEAGGAHIELVEDD
jgi:Alternative complex III, ActD subunit